VAATIVWATLALGVCAAIIWRAEVLGRYYLDKRFGRVNTNDEENRAIELIERRNKAELARQTLDARAALERAGLDRKTALVTLGATLDEELREERLAAERAALQALAKANVKLAEEFARNIHNDSRPQLDHGTLVERYRRYATSMSNTRWDRIVDFAEFVEALNRYEGE